MKQLFQNLKTGEVSVEDVPMPYGAPGKVLIKVTKSLVSLGTEKMLVDFGKAGWLNKARQQPEKVQQVLSKIKTDGLTPTVNAVMSKLDQPLPLGYSAVGIVEQVGAGITDLKVGDRVVSNGPHADYVLVPRNLVAKIPDDVVDEAAVFTVVGAIALQGVRLAAPTIGETFVVVGLGLIGLITVQILIANGCKVICFDFEAEKVKKARSYGAMAFELSELVNPVNEALNLTDGLGVDGVIITASTKSDEVVSQAAQMCRVRGRVILVGVIGLNLKRSDFYEKEITFQVSCSYGPGRYEVNYEDKGYDYPIGFVRWTEQRNFEAVLALASNKKLQFLDLVTQNIVIENAPAFYAGLGENKNELGVVISYLGNDRSKTVIRTLNKEIKSSSKGINISLIGAGQFASSVLLPAFKKQDFGFLMLGSRTGALGSHLAKKYDFHELTTDYDSILNDEKAQNILISTRHNSHAALVLKALQAGKNVFVEKPLALKKEELNRIRSFYESATGPVPVLMVGFNRRFAPLSKALKSHLDKLGSSKTFIFTVNAGAIPKKHWTQDLDVGGGRLVGEGCHFIDLLRFLSGSSIVDAKVAKMKSDTNDSFSISLIFANGDLGVIHYLANGNKEFPKERLEVFAAGKIITLNNFKSLKGIGFKRFKYLLGSQDKGHNEEVSAFANSVHEGKQPIDLNEIFEVSAWSIELQNQLNSIVNA